MKLAALALAAVALVACKDHGATRVAALLEGQGLVQAEHAGKTAAAPNGQPFFLGDAARTGPDAWARLELRGGAVVRLGRDTLVRFVAGGARLEAGEASAETAPVTIITEAGTAQIEPGGVLRASGAAGGLRFEVVVGRAVIQRDDGPLTLDPGTGLVVAIGGAILEKIGGKPPEPKPPEPPPAPPTPAASSIAATVRGRGATARTGTDAARPLAAGVVQLLPGDTVKLPKGASLELARGADKATAVGPAELTVGGPTGPILTAKTGKAQVTARDAELAVAVPGGTIVTHVGGDAGIAVGRTESTARVERGDVALDGDTSDATAQAGETGVIARAGAASVRDPVPTTIDVVLPPGEAAVIHDPGRKVAVRIDFGSSCGGGAGTLELADSRGSFASPRRIGGSSGASFFAAAGANRYRLHCDGGATRSGSIRVAGDTGAAPVVRTAGANDVETDGRGNVVMYQNRIPEITVHWAEARGASTLKIQPASGAARTITGSGPHVLAPGTLGEGSYTLTITAGKRSSPPTPVRIVFDNAAPTAQITAPAARAAWDDPLTVTGVTVEGWSVQVDGKPVDRDASGRFRVEVPTAGKNAIAIRLAHPQHGVHYYLRRRK